jgi:hypothetical protein
MRKHFLAILLYPVSIFGAAGTPQERFLTRARDFVDGLLTRENGYSFATGSLFAIFRAKYDHPIKIYASIPSTGNSFDDILHMGSGVTYALSTWPADDTTVQKESMKACLHLYALSPFHVAQNINNTLKAAPELSKADVTWNQMYAISGAVIGSKFAHSASDSIWQNSITPRLLTSKNEIVQKIAYNAKLIRHLELLMLPLSVTVASDMMALQTVRPLISIQELIQRTVLSTGLSASKAIITNNDSPVNAALNEFYRHKCSSTSRAFRRGLAFGYTTSLLYTLYKMQPSFFAELPKISQSLIKICGAACVARLLFLGYKQMQDMNINLIL